MDRVDGRVLDVLRRVEIRLTGAEADDVAAFGFERSGTRGDGKSRGGLDSLNAIREIHWFPYMHHDIVDANINKFAARFYLCS